MTARSPEAPRGAVQAMPWTFPPDAASAANSPCSASAGQGAFSGESGRWNRAPASRPILHPAEEANLRHWLAGSDSVVILCRATVEQLLAEVDAARAGRPILHGAAPSPDLLAKEAAQLAADGAE